MQKTDSIALLAIVLVLTACDDTTDNVATDEVETVDLEGRPGDPLPPAPPPFDNSQEAAAGYETDLGPAPLAPEVARGATGARNVLLSLARAIELGEVEQAYDLLSERARQQWSNEDFAALFSDLSEMTVAVPDGTLEGAAGTSYYTSNAEITARDTEGRPVRLEGPIVLRRVNDVPGATAQQLSWQVDSIELEQTH